MTMSDLQAETLPLLFLGDSYRFSDIYHVTRFLTPDAFVTFEQNDERIIVIGSLDEGRARKESRATAVINMDAYGAGELAAQAITGHEFIATVIERFLDHRGITRVAVPGYFPIGTADHLRAAGVELLVAPHLVERRRAKRPDEIMAIEETQAATEEAWALGVEAIRRARTDGDGVLLLDGSVFTTEKLRGIIEGALFQRGCLSEDAIVAPGKQAADPHMIGEGPLRANEAIVMDIFPRHQRTRYFADMTRTVSRGEPPREIVRMYEVVRGAQEEAIAMLKPGVTGREVHERVEDFIFEAGYDTLRPGQKRRPGDPVTRGFIHGTGHGVGLENHEAPSLARNGTQPLAAGDVVTIEPGVYDPDIGGVRLEDILVITADGARNLTRAPKELIV